MESNKTKVPTPLRHPLEQNPKNLNPDNKEFESKKTKLLQPVSILDAKVSDFVHWFQDISLVKLAAVLSESALLFAVVSYVVTIPARQQEQIQEARQILYQQSPLTYSEGRISAIKTLNKRCASNPGLEAPKAQLSDLTITPCKALRFTRQWPWIQQQVNPMDLSYSNFQGADLSRANLVGINLEGSNFQGANLERIDLRGANLKGVNLQEANLARADLRGASLNNAILDDSNLYGAQLQNADFSEASLVRAKALWADFHDANFYRANLQSANLNRTQLQGAGFYKANLESALLRFANLKGMSNLQEANLKGSDLWGTQFWSVFQLKQANHWQDTNKIPNWVQQISQPHLPRLRIGILKPNSQHSLFNAYELGMRHAANRRVEIWGIDFDGGVENEARKIQELIDDGMDAIVLVPEDPVDSIPALNAAQDAGVAIITLDFCFDREIAEDFAIACYNTDSFRMGYDSGISLAQWIQPQFSTHSRSNQNQSLPTIQVALVDSAVYDRYYPYLQGFLEAFQESQSQVPLKLVDATSVDNLSDLKQVKQMLRENPQIQILWGGSNLATEVTIEAVQQLGLEDQVAIFGILDLSKQKAEMLLDPESPLQLIIDQAGIQIGYDAAKTAIAVLRGERPGEAYEEFIPEHRLLTQDQPEQVRHLLNEYGSIN
jgi:uncharacterized protein YjbI with pentapeptide repeats/ABC-type sugar transport system substrate-binding protein